MTVPPVSAGLDTTGVAYALRPGAVAMAQTERRVFMTVIMRQGCHGRKDMLGRNGHKTTRERQAAWADPQASI